MTATITIYLPWLLSALTIWMTLLAGRVNRHTWAVGMVAQVGWTIWIVTVQAWGLVPLNVVLWVLYVRNHVLWSRRACHIAMPKQEPLPEEFERVMHENLPSMYER